MLSTAIQKNSHLVYLYANIYSSDGEPIGHAFLNGDLSIQLVLIGGGHTDKLSFCPLIETTCGSYDIFSTSAEGLLDPKVGYAVISKNKATIRFNTVHDLSSTLYMLLQQVEEDEADLIQPSKHLCQIDHF